MSHKIYVNKNKSETFNTISEAIGYANGFWDLPVEIHIAPGVYDEVISIYQPHISLIGEDQTTTIIRNSFAALEKLSDGEKRGTFRTSTLRVMGNNFRAERLTIINDAGSGEEAGQCIAVYVDTPEAVFEQCRFLGKQDTLFLGPLPLLEKERRGFRGPGEFTSRVMGEHYFKSCYIEGDIDFIFGGAKALFDGCEIFSITKNRTINGYVTAPCTPENESIGFVFFRSHFRSNCPDESVYIGRPWREFAQTILIECELDGHIHREGFHDWDKAETWESINFGEYNSIGDGANKKSRASFVKQLNRDEANRILQLWNNPQLSV